MTAPDLEAEVRRRAEALARKMFEGMKDDLYWRARDKARSKRFNEPQDYLRVCDLASDVFEYTPRESC